MGAVTAPAPLGPHHDLSQFSSGVLGLDAWLRSNARLNEARGGARTYVACDGERVVGFYSLAASAVEKRRVPSRVGRSMPEPVPVILLGQLAVDTSCQGRGLGSDLMVDAARRALAASDLIGARATSSALLALSPMRVGGMALPFADANGSDASFTWDGVDVDWADGETVAAGSRMAYLKPSSSRNSHRRSG